MSKKYPDWYELPAERWVRKSQYYKTYGYNSDSQRTRLYRAEAIAWDKILRRPIMNTRFKTTTVPRQFQTIEEIATFTNKILSSAWAKKRFRTPQTPVVVRINTRIRGGWFSFYRGMTLDGTPWSFSISCILHETAHGLHHLHDYSGPGHGRFYVRAYLELVGHLLGPEAQKLLKDAFKEHHIKFTPIKHYSPEVLERKRQLGRELRRRRISQLVF